MARIVPPLPAASRPSNTMTILCPVALTQSCTWQSPVCNRRSSLAYSLPVSLAPGVGLRSLAASSPPFLFRPFFAIPTSRNRRWAPPAPAKPLPAEEKPDVAQLSMRIVENLRAQPVAQRPQFLAEELVRPLGEAFQRPRPVRLRDVDAPAMVVAVAGGKAQHLQLVKTLLRGASDGGVDALHDFRMEIARHEGFVQGFAFLFFLLRALELLLNLGQLRLFGNALQVAGAQKFRAHESPPE